jgi:hypothetical protein
VVSRVCMPQYGKPRRSYAQMVPPIDRSDRMHLAAWRTMT